MQWGEQPARAPFQVRLSVLSFLKGETMDIIELGTIVDETKGGVGCLIEIITCSLWSGER